MSLFAELKRRNVIRVAVAYLVASWLLLQVIDVVLPILKMPDWVAQLVLLLLTVGFFVALVISWAYEITPEGLKRDSEVNPSESIAPQTARKLDMITIALLATVILVVVADRLIPEQGTEPGSAEPLTQAQPVEAAPAAPLVVDDGTPSVAVLPFVNMSDDQQNEYFSDGISEELLNVLVRLEGLRVPSRTSSFSFKGSDQNLVEIGQALNVDHILEGSVRKAGNRIRVTAQLIEVGTDTHLWSDSYTRELDDIFAVQDEIAQAIVDALRLTLSGKDRQNLAERSTENIEAYNHYLQGRYLWNQRTGPSLIAAAKSLREAVDLDPGFDHAWAALADAYVLVPEYNGGTIEEFIPLARDATNKALAINPNSARALATSGYYKAYYDYDWAGANADLQRAVDLEPGYATAHQFYGEILNLQGRLDEALPQLQLAREADPLSVVVRHVPGYVLLWNMRLDEAEAHFMDALELGQPLRWTIHNLDMLNCFKGNWDDARQWARQLAQMEGFDPAPDLARIDAMENPALKDKALELLRQRQDLDDGVFGKAMQYALLGEYESAMDSLERQFAKGDPFATHLNYVKIYDPLHENPRFQAIVRAVNLIPN